MYGVSVEVVGKRGKACWDVSKSVSGGAGKPTHSSTPPPHLSLHPSHSLDTCFHTPILTRHLSPHPHTHPTHLPHTYLTRLSTLSHTHLTPPHTLSHFPTPVAYGEHFFKVCFTPLYAAACWGVLNKYVKDLDSSMRSDI